MKELLKSAPLNLDALLFKFDSTFRPKRAFAKDLEKNGSKACKAKIVSVSSQVSHPNTKVYVEMKEKIKGYVVLIGKDSKLMPGKDINLVVTSFIPEMGLIVCDKEYSFVG